MSTPSASTKLTQEHRDIDAGIEAFIADARQTQALDAAIRLLRQHIYVEEAVLFGPLEQSGLTMPVFVMKREHGQMWTQLATLDAARAQNAAPATLQAQARALLDALQIHNGKEEEIVYTFADRLIAASPAHPFVGALRARRHMPQGWRCAMAPPPDHTPRNRV
ncbi:hemerythrin domain-containing protein [Sinimarinibacterium sp. NLF-5-8]|uniref:hemerythrin domain-containing protein n=1 Tax=Sinimarinibacterium sp. NLF-5-8 TaxID=2698684 RepID=UPI00137BA7D7|nr:hemerythrin domain-containing protein [Sinimarinibacterium sp. NLF-5-8]QHS11197.1 hemerythrin domain-containing protein [Sinimarinibacterium sp. NLF-5-8]